MNEENKDAVQCKTCKEDIYSGAGERASFGAEPKSPFWGQMTIIIVGIIIIVHFIYKSNIPSPLPSILPSSTANTSSLSPSTPAAAVATPAPTPTPLPQPEIPVAEVSSKELIDAYARNEVGADKKYKDKFVSVTGVVSTIARDIIDRVYVTLEGGTANEVQCYFTSKDEVEKAAELEPGQTVTITGIIEGLSFYNITLNEGAITYTSTYSSINVKQFLGTYFNEDIGTCSLLIEMSEKNKLHIFAEDIAEGYGLLLDEYTALPTSEVLQFYGYNGPYRDTPLTITFYPENGSLYYDGYWVDGSWFGLDVSGWFYKAG